MLQREIQAVPGARGRSAALWQGGLLFAAYLIAAVAGLQWAQVQGAGSPIWPAFGFSMAGLLLGGIRLWPAIVLGRLAAGIIVSSNQPLWAELVIALCNGLADVCAVALLLHFGGIRRSMSRLTDVWRLALAVGISAALSASIGAWCLQVSSGLTLHQTLDLWTAWWFANLVAGLTITPFTHFSHLRHSLVSVEPLHHDLQALAGQASATPRGAKTIVPRERIALKNVTFTYNGLADPALRAIEVDIPVGSAVAFVGSTGAGKSTLVDVLLGLLEPEQGAVMVDDTDIRAIGAIGRWQSAIGYVPQSIYLLDDTIRRNIALGVEDEAIDEPALREAIRVAQLESFIARQPQGLDTPVGERGVRLSGGERQRIGIARALYHDPSIIVFDEATSALDNTTERAVIEAVEQLRGRRTIIMIAHRLTTVKDCDRLYYLKQGAIEAEGDFEMLTNSHDEFRRMARA